MYCGKLNLLTSTCNILELIGGVRLAWTTIYTFGLHHICLITSHPQRALPQSVRKQRLLHFIFPLVVNPFLSLQKRSRGVRDTLTHCTTSLLHILYNVCEHSELQQQ